MHIRLFSVSLGVALLSACATPAPAPAVTQVAAQDASNCKVDYRTGTNIPVKTCTSEEDLRLQKQQAEMAIQSMRTNAVKSSP